MSSSPAVSVVLTVYNRARFAAEAIDSILAQTLADFELIIVDDGSTDNSPEVIADYAKRDSRIAVVTQKNAGVAAARNAAVKKARADLLAVMDDDDHPLPIWLEKQAAFLHSRGDIDCCVPCMSQMNESGELIRAAQSPGALPDFFSVESNSPVYFIGSSGTMIRRRVFEEVGGFREYFRIMEESDFTLRFVESRRAIGVVAGDLYRRRIYRGAGGTSLTTSWPLLQFKYTAAGIVSAHCRRLGKNDPIEKSKPLGEMMEGLPDLPEATRIHLLRQARNCARRILRDGTREGGVASRAEFWEAVGYISEMSSGLERRTNSILRWLLWRSLRYGRFSIAARLIKNFAVRI